MARYLMLKLGGIDPENPIEPPLTFSLQRQIKKKKAKKLRRLKINKSVRITRGTTSVQSPKV